VEVIVGTGAELVAALKVAAAGDTMLLRGGDYSNLSLKSFNFSTPVTITSADPNDPAVFSNLTLRSVTGLTIRDVDFRADPASTTLSIGDSHGLVFDHLSVYGSSLTDLKGTGILVRNSTDVVISNSEFSRLGAGVAHLDSDGLTITGNTFHDIRTDGIHGGGTSNVLIANNQFSDFYRNPGEHPDAIQFWTANTDASAHDIVIRDNLIMRGAGNSMQGIFVGDESKGRLPFINLTITGNTVVGSMYNGIAVGQAQHVLISDNTVVGFADMKAWITVNGVVDGTISNNVTSKLSFGDGNVGLVNVANQIVDVTSREVETYSLAWHMKWDFGGGGFLPGQGGDPTYGFDPFGDMGGFYAMAPAEPIDGASMAADAALHAPDAAMPGFSIPGWFA